MTHPAVKEQVIDIKGFDVEDDLIKSIQEDIQVITRTTLPDSVRWLVNVYNEYIMSY